VRGALAARILAPQWMSRLDYPAATGYIEFVAVAERWRRLGIATGLVEGVIAQTLYTDFELEVTDVNTSARGCYRKIGFVYVRRNKERFGRIKGFRERIYMHYPREPTPARQTARDVPIPRRLVCDRLVVQRVVHHSDAGMVQRADRMHQHRVTAVGAGLL
jgi:hypothetical protein